MDTTPMCAILERQYGTTSHRATTTRKIVREEKGKWIEESAYYMIHIYISVVMEDAIDILGSDILIDPVFLEVVRILTDQKFVTPQDVHRDFHDNRYVYM
jgi:hypothetical protein